MAFGAGKHTPTTPDPVTEDQVIKWTLRTFSTDYGVSEDRALVTAVLLGWKADDSSAKDSAGNQISKTVSYRGSDARTLIDSMNVQDYSGVTTLDQWLLGQFETDGHLPAGTVS